MKKKLIVEYSKVSGFTRGETIAVDNIDDNKEIEYIVNMQGQMNCGHMKIISKKADKIYMSYTIDGIGSSDDLLLKVIE